MRLTVVGLGNQQPPSAFLEMLSAGPVLSRDAAITERWLAGSKVEAIDLGHIFDHSDVPAIPDLFQTTIRQSTSAATSATYLVPGAANIGDETVRLLDQDYELNIIPGTLPFHYGLGSVQILDVLALALAETRHPFDAGVATFDTRVPTIITNVRGRTIVELAERRLQRLLGDKPPDASDGLIILPGIAEPTESTAFDGLAEIVSILRSPDGCPWDREQTVESLLPQLREEIDEFFEAWQNETPSDQADELGDVLLHIMMISQIARESGRFTISDVLRYSSAKMLRRHPHVFGDAQAESMEDLHRIWNEVKEREKAEKTIE